MRGGSDIRYRLAMQQAARRCIALTFALAIGACGREPSTSLQTLAPTAPPQSDARLVGNTTTTDTVPASGGDVSAPVTAPKPIVISDKLALERLPDTFEPVVAAERFVGRFGEPMALQLFGSSIRHGSVTVWIVHGRPATDLLIEPSYAPSTLSVSGLSLFEYQNRTTLTSNVLAWSIAPDVVVGVTSREISKVELLEWIPLIDAQP
jgi:hypothetical protein